jgi:hypothetical protein
MPTSADGWAVETSVAVAALDAGHAAHAVCAGVVRSRRPALAGHAEWETFSVLTRMPGENDRVVVSTVTLDRSPVSHHNDVRPLGRVDPCISRCRHHTRKVGT